MRNTIDNIKTIVAKTVAGLGFEFVGIESISEGGRIVLRLYVDAAEGITVGEIQKISRQVSSLLDVEYASENPYVLEVSSPGLDRILFEPSQYPRFIGSKVKLKLTQPVEGRRQFTGTLVAADDEQVEIVVDEQTLAFRFNDIDRARLVPDFDKK